MEYSSIRFYQAINSIFTIFSIIGNIGGCLPGFLPSNAQFSSEGYFFISPAFIASLLLQSLYKKDLTLHDSITLFSSNGKYFCLYLHSLFSISPNECIHICIEK